MKILDVLARFLRARSFTARARADGAPKLRRRPQGRRPSAAPAAPRAQGRPVRERADSAVAEPFPADPGLPHLEVATDPQLMREVFQGHLRPLDGKAYEVRECQISYIRYRQAVRCILQYSLRLKEPGAGREWEQWVTGTMYAGGRTRRRWQKLRRSEPGREVSDALRTFEPVSFIPDLEMLVQVFPYDRRLPALPVLMAGPPPELEPLLLTSFGPGEWRAEAWDVEPVQYLGEERATLRLTGRARDAASGRAEERRFYAKVYNDEEKGERTHQVLQALWDKAGAGGASFTVGRPIAYLSGLRTLLQEEVPGTSLHDILLQDYEPIPAVRRAARALAALHLDHVATPQRYRRNYLAELENIGILLQRLCPHLGPEIEKTVGAIVAGFEEVPPAPTHGDLFPAHIMVDGDRLALIDLDTFDEADPVWEVAEFLAYLTNAPFGWLPLPQDRAWRAAEAFAEEYFSHVPEAWRDRLSFHYAGVILQFATGLFRSQMPGWSDKIEALVQEAKDSLAGKVW